MIYAKDQWVQMPVRDLYDSQMMMASINAAKDMYEKGLQEMKEFKKEYEDFTSPIEKDVEYWNNHTIKPIRETIDKMYEMGINPLTNREARVYLSQLRNRVPVAELNKRRQAAAAADVYLKNKAALEAKGLFNEEYERAQLGGKTLKEWDTSEDGMWSRTSPSEFLDLKSATDNYYAGIEATNKGLDKNRGVQVMSIDDNDLQRVADNNVEAFKKTPLGKFYFNKIKEQVASNNPYSPNEDIDKQSTALLAKSIANSQTSRKKYDEKEDPIFMANYRNMLAMRLADHNRAGELANYRAQKKIDKEFADDEKNNPNLTPLTYTESVDKESAIKKWNSVNKERSNPVDMFTKARQFYETQMNRLIKRADVNKDGKVDKAEQERWKTAYKNLTPAQKKEYRMHAQHYRILTKGIKTYSSKKIKNPEKVFTLDSALWNLYNERVYGNSNSPAYKNDNTTVAINKAFGRSETTNLSPSQIKTASTALAKGDAIQSPWKNKYRTIDVSNSSSVRFSPIQKGNAVGGRVYRYGSLQRKLDRHLSRNVQSLYLVDNQGMSIADVGKYRYTTGYGTIPLSRIINFNGAGRDQEAIRELQSIGVHIVTANGNTPNGNENISELVAKIPVTDRHKIGGLSDAQLNDEHTKRVYGNSEASKWRINNQAKALIQEQQLQ